MGGHSLNEKKVASSAGLGYFFLCVVTIIKTTNVANENINVSASKIVIVITSFTEDLTAHPAPMLLYRYILYHIQAGVAKHLFVACSPSQSSSCSGSNPNFRDMVFPAHPPTRLRLFPPQNWGSPPIRHPWLNGGSVRPWTSAHYIRRRGTFQATVANTKLRTNKPLTTLNDKEYLNCLVIIIPLNLNRLTMYSLL